MGKDSRIDDIPTFSSTDDGQHFMFTCPKCGKVNRHAREEGHRVSHCPCWPRGYILKAAA